ncbi:uncharacterized protein LOC135389456 [Ornithodoros turicata]|uniref:uncharacterized protein LOC135389456 n=1 Tax=Ornithodoros turicata TaxID=34597 RepID=UPI003138CAFB
MAEASVPSSEATCQNVSDSGYVEDVTIFTFGEDATGEQRTCRRVELWLTSQHDRRDVRVEALEVPMICSDVMKAPVDILRDQLHAQGIVIADASLHGIQCEDGISVLIGADNYWPMVTGGLKRLDKTLVAVETIFGWTVQGPTTTDSSATRSSTGVMRVAVTDAVNRKISAQLRAFWELEHMGIKEEQSTVTNENEILNQFEDTVKVENGRYQVSFPWNEKVARLRDNKEIAMKRLGPLTKRLLRDEQIMKEYDTGMREYMENGIAEEAPETAIASPNPLYYMPHQSVVRCDSKTTKLRIVFDASSSAPGCLSLNDTLSSGPNLNPSLIDLLLKFRIHQIAVLADIQKAFLQVSLSEEDRDALRFLWYKETPLPGMELPPIVTWRMTRVPFGATASPFLLAATIKHHLESLQNQYPVTTKILMNDMYVDDLVTGANSLEEAESICVEANNILSQANMRLRKWMSNDEELLQRISERQNGGTTSLMGEMQPRKVLGVAWNPRTDKFGFDLSALIGFTSTTKNSKRAVLQSCARIFDPFGFLAPVVTSVKLLFQALWERGTD